jgi:hypothetical protein
MTSHFGWVIFIQTRRISKLLTHPQTSCFRLEWCLFMFHNLCVTDCSFNLIKQRDCGPVVFNMFISINLHETALCVVKGRGQRTCPCESLTRPTRGPSGGATPSNTLLPVYRCGDMCS